MWALVVGYALSYYLKLWSRDTLLYGEKSTPVCIHASNYPFHVVLSHQLKAFFVNLENIEVGGILNLLTLLFQFNCTYKQEIFLGRDRRVLAHCIYHSCILDI